MEINDKDISLIKEIIDGIPNSNMLSQYEDAINKMIMAKKFDLIKNESSKLEYKNIIYFIDFFESQMKKLNLTIKQVANESGVSITTLYKCSKLSTDSSIKAPSIYIRSKIVQYLKQKEKEINGQ